MTLELFNFFKLMFYLLIIFNKIPIYICISNMADNIKIQIEFLNNKIYIKIQYNNTIIQSKKIENIRTAANRITQILIFWKI